MTSCITKCETNDSKGDSTSKSSHALDGLSMLPYHERVTHFIRGSTRHRAPQGVTVVDFRPLYTVAIHHIQRELVKCIADAQKKDFTNKQLHRIGGLLHRYTDALRDFEFIHGTRWNTQFVKDIAASRLDNGPDSLLQAALMAESSLEAKPNESLSTFQDSDLLGMFDPKLMRHSSAVSRSLGTARWDQMASDERRAQLRLALRRFGFAVVGGLIMVLPMFVLAWGHAAPKTLAVVATSILLFASGVSVLSTTEPESLLAITAAYAAVLMTLVGNGNNNDVVG